MKMYPELCKEILRRTEQLDGFPSLEHYDIEGYSDDEVGYNCGKLTEEGLLIIVDARSRDNLYGFYPRELTLAGHKFLENAMNDHKWTKALDYVKRNGLTLTLEAIRIALSQG